MFLLMSTSPSELLLRPVRHVVGDDVRRRLALLVVLAGVVGALAGLAYMATVELVARVLGPEHAGVLPHAIILVAVGGSVTLLTRWLGDPGDVELLVDNIHVDGGRQDMRNLVSLIPTSVLCVAAGGPLGPEAPVVNTTGTLASWMGLRAGFDRDVRRIVTITGMAAGFTVLFGAPLGSAVFALEILHRRGLEYYEALIPAAVGSLCGYAVGAVALGVGLHPLWSFPGPTAITTTDLGYAVGAGVAGALIAAAFTYATIGARAVADRLPNGTRPLIGGALIAGLAWWSPYALTNGDLQIDKLTLAGAAGSVLLVAGIAKFASAVVALASGWRGGFIIPLFFIGYCLAGAAADHLPGSNRWVLAAALMVAINVGVTKTPLGSTLVVTEIASMALLPTTLVAALVSLLLTNRVGLIDSQRRRFHTDP